MYKKGEKKRSNLVYEEKGKMIDDFFAWCFEKKKRNNHKLSSLYIHRSLSLTSLTYQVNRTVCSKRILWSNSLLLLLWTFLSSSFSLFYFHRQKAKVIAKLTKDVGCVKSCWFTCLYNIYLFDINCNDTFLMCPRVVLRLVYIYTIRSRSSFHIFKYTWTSPLLCLWYARLFLLTFDLIFLLW